MLASAETIMVAADALKRHEINTSIVDPVRLRFHSRSLYMNQNELRAVLTT